MNLESKICGLRVLLSSLRRMVCDRHFCSRRLHASNADPPNSALLAWSSSFCLLLPSLPSMLVFGTLMLTGPQAGFGQVSPAEIRDPQLETVEKTYLPQLISLNRAIGSTKFSYPFRLRRYLGQRQLKLISADTRGVEFVKFDGRVVLKISGDYHAAYNAELLTKNQRASRVFEDTIIPILRLIPAQIPANVPCDGMGFEIAYNLRTVTKNYDYEGTEMLVVVFDKADAFSFLKSNETTRQEILNRSLVYVDNQEFGLALVERDPFPARNLDRSAWYHHQPAPPSDTAQDKPASTHGAELASAGSNRGLAGQQSGVVSTSAVTSSDLKRLQARYQKPLDALAKEGFTKFHFVDYAPPSFVEFRGRIYLQVTLRNPQHFDIETTSIYKRAAQSFDLFLAPQLKGVLEKVPASAALEGLDLTVLNQLASKSTPSSEAIEFACPIKPLREFINAEITNQELIKQSVVLVNGERIVLDLQRVE